MGRQTIQFTPKKREFLKQALSGSKHNGSLTTYVRESAESLDVVFENHGLIVNKASDTLQKALNTDFTFSQKTFNSFLCCLFDGKVYSDNTLPHRHSIEDFVNFYDAIHTPNIFLNEEDIKKYNLVIEEISEQCPHLQKFNLKMQANWRLLPEEAETKIEGAIIVNQSYCQKILQNFQCTPSEFYLSKLHDEYQWFGVINGFDIIRQEVDDIVSRANSAFYSSTQEKVISVVSGIGGAGKSTLLRRAALEIMNNNSIIVWVNEYEFDDFMDVGLPDIKANKANNYIIIIEDWYRLIENYKSEAKKFLSKTRGIANVRIMIGDRASNGFYSKYIAHSNLILALNGTSNWDIIQNIITKNKRWNIDLENTLKFKERINNTSLFLMIYVLVKQYELDNNITQFNFSNPEKAFQNLIVSDIKKLHNAFPGLGKVLFYWGNIYEKSKIHITYNTFLELANHFNKSNDLMFSFRDLQNGDSKFHTILRNYITIKKSHNKEYIRFNHDLFADLGIAKIDNDLESMSYDDIAKSIILNTLFKIDSDQKSIALLLFHFLQFEKRIFINDAERLSYIERLLDGGNTDLSFLNRMTDIAVNEEIQLCFIKKLFANKVYPQAYIKKQIETYPIVCSYILRNITDFNDLPANVYFDAKKGSTFFADKQMAVNSILNADNILVYNDRVLADALKVSNNSKAKIKGIKKMLADTKDYLSVDKILLQRILRYANNDELTKAPLKAILNYDNITELPIEIVTEAFRKSQDDNDKLKASNRILNSDMVTENARYKMVSLAMIECPDKRIKLSMAERIIKNSDQYHPSLKWHSLGCFTNEKPIPDYVVIKVIHICENFDTMKKQYNRITRIPFHNISWWRYRTKWLLRNWRRRERNLIHNVLLSYRNLPEMTKKTCTEILGNWREEIEIPIEQIRPEEPCHYGDHIKLALEHPHLQELASKTALEIRQAHTDKSCNKVKLHLQKTISKILDS